MSEKTEISPATPAASPRRHTVLIVDDDRLNIELVRDALEGGGYDFLTARDGQTALELFRAHDPDLVISDVEMPKLGGLELCRVIKHQTSLDSRFTPVILMTAREEVDYKIEGLDLGADDYLIKPLNLLELGARVRSMLRLKRLNDELIDQKRMLQESNRQLHEISITDPLTGIYNRLYFAKRLRYECRRALRYGTDLTCLMIDIDHFKAFNDTWGHPAGDAVLQGVARTLSLSLRKVDLLARYGGEEIVVVLPETGVKRGLEVAERLREAVKEAKIEFGGRSLACTVSVGIAQLDGVGQGADAELLKAADDAMYQAKQTGRDRVCVAGVSCEEA